MAGAELEEKNRIANGLLAKNGYFIQHVFDVAIPYSFTSGLSYAKDERGPEFVIANFDLLTMQAFLNGVVEQVQAGNFAPSGAGYFGRDLGREIAFVPIDPHASSSRLLVPEHAEAFLIVMPDEMGLFPWEAGCDPSFDSQLTGFEVLELPGRKSPGTSPTLN